MTSGRAPLPASTHSRLSLVAEGELAAYRGSAYLPLRVIGSDRADIHATAAFGYGPLARKTPRAAIARQWTSRPRVLLDHELRIVRANRCMCRSFGVLQRNLAGTRLDDWININASVVDRLRGRIENGTMPWHVILRLRLSGPRVLAVSQILWPLRSLRSGYLLISLAGIQLA